MQSNTSWLPDDWSLPIAHYTTVSAKKNFWAIVAYTKSFFRVLHVTPIHSFLVHIVPFLSHLLDISSMSNYYPHRHPHPQQQQLNGTSMLPHQQPLLHQPPIVYGNYNVPSSPQYNMYPYYHYQATMDMTNSSPISMASSTDEIPRTPPTAINHSTSNKPLTHVSQGTAVSSVMVNPLVPPPPPPPLSSSSSQLKSTEDRVKATIARANALPLEFYQTEFLEYSTQQPSGNGKRKRTAAADDEQETNQQKRVEDQV